MARARGVKSLYGDTLASNRPMLELARKLGFKVGRHPDESHLTRVTLAL